MAKQISVDVLISQMHKLNEEDKTKLYAETAKSIAEDAKVLENQIAEAQGKLELIRKGGK